MRTCPQGAHGPGTLAFCLPIKRVVWKLGMGGRGRQAGIAFLPRKYHMGQIVFSKQHNAFLLLELRNIT